MSDFGAYGADRPQGEPAGQSFEPEPVDDRGQLPADRSPSGQPYEPPSGSAYPPGPKGHAPPPQGDGYPGGPQGGDYGPGPQGGGYPSGPPQSGGYPPGAPGGYSPGWPGGGGHPPGMPAGPSSQGSPGGYSRGGDYLQGGPDQIQGPLRHSETQRRGWARVTIALVATATAVVLAAGGVYAYSALSGGPAQLAAHTPGDAVAYLEVNLDPPAAQKVAAIRFLRKFPDAKTGDENGSLLDSVIEPLIPDEKSRRLYTEDVKTWLGDHAAVVADPQGGTVRTVVLAETTDEDKTRTGLDRINAEQADEKSKVRYAIADGVVYLAETQQAADTAARDGGATALDANGTFGGDVKKVGTDGIVTFWTDLTSAAKYDAQVGRSAAQGRVAGSLRFTDTTADLRIRTIGNQTKTGSQAVGPRLAKLPDDTAIAIGLSGGDELVRTAYDQLEEAGLSRMLDKAERDSGLRLPDDVAALVGSSTVVALGGTDDRRGLGLVSTTDDPASARRAADTLLRKVDPDSTLTVRSTADGTVLASSAAYADQLTADGGLGRQQLFTDSLPDLDRATAVVYVDLQKAADISGDELPSQVAALRSVGLTASSTGDESDVHLRLVAG